jgi:YHS domain-containing protein
MTFRVSVLTFAAFTASMAQVAGPAGGQNGTPLKLIPSEPLSEPHPPKPAETANTNTSAGGVRPAILKLKPAGDPISLVEESSSDPDSDKWRTYQRPKVDRFSKDGNGVALHGYDVVSYFEGRAEPGRKEFSVEYGGIDWYFTSTDHRDAFRQDPDRLLPQYGGFCAYSVGRGYPATADPQAFLVKDGKLYLFFDKAVRTVSEQDEQHLIVSADRHWPKLHR